MYSTHDISTLKKMTVAERKAEAMRQLKESFDKESFDLAERSGTVRSREAKAG